MNSEDSYDIGITLLHATMYLFFDGVSSHGYIGLFDSDTRESIDSEVFRIQGNESTKIIPLIDTFLKKNHTSYDDIKNIVVITGPGSFTGIRTISLIVNTLSYIYPNILLTPISFFDLYDEYPVVKSSSKRDLFVKYTKSDTIGIVQNTDLHFPESVSTIYGDTDIYRLSQTVELDSSVDYTKLMKNLPLDNMKIVSPLYIKKPNIS